MPTTSTRVMTIVQARMSSRRLPAKMMMTMGGLPLFEYVCRRCARIQAAEDLVLATSSHTSDDPLALAAGQRDLTVYRGQLDDVLGRFIDCAHLHRARVVVRVCGDSPFVDTRVTDALVGHLLAHDLDYVSLDKHHCIAGLDAEVVRVSALERIDRLTQAPEDREHVCLYIRRRPEQFRAAWLQVPLDPFGQKYVLTVDTMADYERCRQVAEGIASRFGAGNFDFSSTDVFAALCELDIRSRPRSEAA